MTWAAQIFSRQHQKSKQVWFCFSIIHCKIHFSHLYPNFCEVLILLNMIDDELYAQQLKMQYSDCGKMFKTLVYWKQSLCQKCVKEFSTLVFIKSQHLHNEAATPNEIGHTHSCEVRKEAAFLL